MKLFYTNSVKRIITSNVMKNTLTLLVLLLSLGSFSQIPEGEMLNFYGKITKMTLKDSAEKPLDGVIVQFWADNEMIGEVVSAKKGKYSLNLPFRSTYQVKYTCNGYIQKIIEVDVSKFFAEAEDMASLKMQVDISLFKNEGFMGLDFMMNTPVAIARYHPRKKTLVWDSKYHDTMKDRITSVLHAYGY